MKNVVLNLPTFAFVVGNSEQLDEIILTEPPTDFFLLD